MNVLNLTGRAVSYSNTVFKNVGPMLGLKVTKTNERLTKSGITVYDIVYDLPVIDNIVADAIIVPSLTAFVLGPKLNKTNVYFSNTNPGYVQRDANDQIDYNTLTSVQQMKDSTTFVRGTITTSSEEIINDIYNFTPHDINIYKDNKLVQVITNNGNEEGRSAFIEEKKTTIETTNGPLVVVEGTNIIEPIPIKDTGNHDGVIVSANYYGLISQENDESLKKIFRRDKLSILVVDNANMVKNPDGIIIGTKFLLCPRSF